MAATQAKVYSQAIQVSNVWLPCEYIKTKLGCRVLSLGDIDADATNQQDDQSLNDAAAKFLAKLSGDRKLVVLVPAKGIPESEWPCKQMLKKELASTKYNESN